MIRTNYQQSSHSPIPYSAPVSLPLAFLGQFQASVASLLHAAASKDEVHIGIHPGFNLLIVHEICGYIMKYYELLWIYIYMIYMEIVTQLLYVILHLLLKLFTCEPHIRLVSGNILFFHKSVSPSLISSDWVCQEDALWRAFGPQSKERWAQNRPWPWWTSQTALTWHDMGIE